jgi:hypothetical protein
MSGCSLRVNLGKFLDPLALMAGSQKSETVSKSRLVASIVFGVLTAGTVHGIYALGSYLAGRCTSGVSQPLLGPSRPAINDGKLPAAPVKAADSPASRRLKELEQQAPYRVQVVSYSYESEDRNSDFASGLRTWLLKISTLGAQSIDVRPYNGHQMIASDQGAIRIEYAGHKYFVSRVLYGNNGDKYLLNGEQLPAPQTGKCEPICLESGTHSFSYDGKVVFTITISEKT